MTGTWVVVPFAGGGTSAFTSWRDHIDELGGTMQVVILPGRERRFREPYRTDWRTAVADLRNQISIDGSVSLRLVGHSLGALLALDVARLIESEGLTVDAVCISGVEPPHLGSLPAPMSSWSAAEIMSWLGRNGHLEPHVLDDEYLREMALDLLRADLRLREQRFSAEELSTTDPVPLAASLVVLRGDEDPVVSAASLGEWGAYSGRPPGVRDLPGGHFFDKRVWTALPKHFDDVLTMHRFQDEV